MIFKSRYIFRQQVESLRPALYKLAWSWCHDVDLADDLVQDTCAKALKNRRQLKDMDKIKPWLTRILVNKHMDYLRTRKVVVEFGDEHLIDTDDPTKVLSRADTIQQVRTAISQLNDDHRIIITLVDLAEFSYAEVANILQIPVGTVMSRLNRARKQLKLNLETKDNVLLFPINRRVKK